MLDGNGGVNGGVQQFDIRGTAIETRPGAAPNGVIVHHVPGSTVSRIDEYLNYACDAQLGLGG
ncbi:MAG TPA: hypothetical protein VLX59_10655 [Acidimicrobiales bacterium]|nr:hypothetical protein [Acidimicrobiales bacterium]